MSRPTFAALNQVLQDLGYTAQTVADSHVLFEYTEPNRRIILRVYRPEDPVDLAGLAYVRSALDAWGILNRDEFDEKLRERSLAG
jgi:hypothetical protein